MFRDNKMERNNTRTTLFAQILLFDKKREIEWKLWAWLLHKIRSQPSYLGHQPISLLLNSCSLGAATGPIYMSVQGRFVSLCGAHA